MSIKICFWSLMYVIKVTKVCHDFPRSTTKWYTKYTHTWKKLGKNFLQNFWQIYRRYLRSYLILITHTQMMTEKQWRIQESKIVDFKQWGKIKKTCFKAYLWKFFLSFLSLWHAFKISYATTHIISSGLVSILDHKQQKHR